MDEAKEPDECEGSTVPAKKTTTSQDRNKCSQSGGGSGARKPRTRHTDEEILEDLDRRIAALQEQRRAKQAAVRSKARKAEAHRKIVACATIEERLGAALTDEQARALGSVARYLWGSGYEPTAEDGQTGASGRSKRQAAESWLAYARRAGDADFQREKAGDSARS